MSDAPADGDAPVDTDPRPDESGARSDDGLVGDGVRRYVYYGTLVGLLVLGFVALVQFYLSVGSLISTWITAEYRQLFRAGFNLVVLLCVALVVSLLLRRMEGRNA